MIRLRRVLSCLAVILTAPVADGRAEIPVGGRVLGPDGQGLEGVHVGLEPIHPAYERVAIRLEGDVGPGAETEATTDADGYFELLAPRVGAWKVVVPWGNDAESHQAPDYVTQEHLLWPLIETAEFPQVVLKQASAIDIKVLDETGKPVDARLGLSDRRRARDGWRTRLRLARTGDDGIARMFRGDGEETRLEVLGPSHPLVIFSGDELGVKGDSIELRLPPDFTPGTVNEATVALEPLRLVRGRVVDLESRDGVAGGLHVVLDSGVSGVGRVVDEGEAPVIGAEVRLVPVNPAGDRPASRTDSQGRFRLAHLAPGRYDLEVEAAGFVHAAVPGLLVDTKTGEADFGTVVLAPEARLEGTVRDLEGAPVAQAEIHIATVHTPISLGQSKPLTLSDAGGRFTVGDLRADEPYILVVAKSGYSSETTSAVAKDGGTAPAGEIGGKATVDVVRVDVVLQPVGAVAGHVRNEDGAPVAGASVHVDSARPYVYSVPRPAQTDEQGAFRCENVDPGTVQLSAQAEGYQKYQLRSLKVPARGEASDLEIVLVRGATIVGTVTRADGTPVIRATVTYSPARGSSMFGGHQGSSETDDAGHFRFEGIAAGPAVIGAHLNDYRRVLKSVEIRSGTQAVDLVFEDGFEISGRVRDASGRPLAAHWPARS